MEDFRLESLFSNIWLGRREVELIQEKDYKFVKTYFIPHQNYKKDLPWGTYLQFVTVNPMPFPSPEKKMVLFNQILLIPNWICWKRLSHLRKKKKKNYSRKNCSFLLTFFFLSYCHWRLKLLNNIKLNKIS